MSAFREWFCGGTVSYLGALSHGIEGEKKNSIFIPPPTIPASTENRTCKLWVTSQIL